MRTPRPKAIALAAIVGILASAPAMAFAQQEQAQAATEVTVDLSGLNRDSRHEPLAQTPGNSLRQAPPRQGQD